MRRRSHVHPQSQSRAAGEALRVLSPLVGAALAQSLRLKEIAGLGAALDYLLANLLFAGTCVWETSAGEEEAAVGNRSSGSHGRQAEPLVLSTYHNINEA